MLNLKFVSFFLFNSIKVVRSAVNRMILVQFQIKESVFQKKNKLLIMKFKKILKILKLIIFNLYSFICYIIQNNFLEILTILKAFVLFFISLKLSIYIKNIVVLLLKNFDNELFCKNIDKCLIFIFRVLKVGFNCFFGLLIPESLDSFIDIFFCLFYELKIMGF